MKKILIGLLVVLLAATSLGYPSANNARSTFRNGYQWSGNSKDNATLWAQGIEGAVAVGARLGTGQVFYVDSNVGTEGDGKSWTDAKDTLNEAVDLCVANRGDFIIVAQGHAETVDEVDEVDLDVAGITVIGTGNGTLMPTFTYTVAAGEIVIGAANVRVENLFCVTSVTAVLTAIDVEAAGDNFEIINCKIGFPVAGTVDEFLASITINTTVNNGLIQGCDIRSGLSGAEYAVKVVSGTTGLEIYNNWISGDYSVGLIMGESQFTDVDNVICMYNTLFSGTMAGDSQIADVLVFSMPNNAGGLFAHNTVICDVATALLMRTGDDMVFMNNEVTDTDGDEFTSGRAYGTAISTSVSVASFTDG